MSPLQSSRLDVPFNDLGRAVGQQREELLAVLAEVLDSGWYVHGTQHAAFEAELAGYLGVGRALGVASGTDALELALAAVTGGRAGSVLMAANAGGYAAVAALRVGLRPRWADVDPATLLLDPASVAERWNDDVRAVVVTHLYGRAADVEPLRALCRERGAALVEDCAQSLGAARDGSRAGTWGDVATFSFYPTKNLGALGDGGAVATDDPVLAERIGALRQYGWGAKYVVEVGGGANSRLDEVQAAVLRRRLPRLDADNARRREIVQAYRQAGGPVEVLPAEDGGHVAHLAVARARDRDAARAALLEAGVRTDVHYPVPDHRQPAWAGLHDGAPLPVTEQAAGTLFTLPCFPELTDDEVLHVCRALAAL